MTVVENSLEMIAVAFERQLDSLYRHEAMDIQTDIDVLETCWRQTASARNASLRNRV